MEFIICSFGGALVWGILYLGERSFRGASGRVKGLHPLVHLGELLEEASSSCSFRGAVPLGEPQVDVVQLHMLENSAGSLHLSPTRLGEPVVKFTLYKCHCNERRQYLGCTHNPSNQRISPK